MTALEPRQAGELVYPLAPMRCEPRPPALNILLVVIDAMRADALTPAIAPRLTGFARSALDFDQHYSGGNEVRGPGYRLASSQAPPRDAMRAAMLEMSRFYR